MGGGGVYSGLESWSNSGYIVRRIDGRWGAKILKWNHEPNGGKLTDVRRVRLPTSDIFMEGLCLAVDV